MSDRLMISIALIPVVAGAVILALFQRPPAVQAAPNSARRVSGEAAADRRAAATDAWVGVVTAQSTAELAADSDGRVARTFLPTGARVNAGDKILELDRSEVLTAVGVAGAELGQRSSEVARAESRLEIVKGKLGRVQAGAEWLSQQEVESASGELRVAEAELRAAKAAVGISRARLEQQNIRAKRHVLVAPFSGTVVTSDVDVGDSVKAGQVLVRVFSVERLVRFAMPRSFLQVAQRSAVRIHSSDSKAVILSRVADIRPELDPAAQLVFATAPLTQDALTSRAWLPGTPVEVTPVLDVAQLEAK